MDPNACWRAARDAAAAGDPAAAWWHLVDLQEWLKKGGFPPTELTAARGCPVPAADVVAAGLLFLDRVVGTHR